jgi:hypothetical protein
VGDSDQARRADSPRWDTVFLVCKQCRKRSNGPEHLKTKALARTLRAATREQRPRPRIVMTSCLGLCPKRAIALAYVGMQARPRILAIKSSARLAKALPLLVGENDPPP